MNDKIYTVTVDMYEWEYAIGPKPFSSLQKAIEYANMYATYKDEHITRYFVDKEEVFTENNWRGCRSIITRYNNSGCEGNRWIFIEELTLDDFNGLANG